jgi:hypothetical protein
MGEWGPRALPGLGSSARTQLEGIPCSFPGTGGNLECGHPLVVYALLSMKLYS